MAMDRSAAHEIMARPAHDQTARIQYVINLKRFLMGVTDGNRRALTKRAGENAHSVETVRQTLAHDPFYQMWSAVNRTSQDLMWNNVEDGIQSDLPRMTEAARRLDNDGAGGTLTLDPEFAAPAYAYKANIHGQPGGYMRDEGPDDLIAGALYESGGNAFSFGAGAGARDSKALAIIHFLETRYGAFDPATILDIGCSAGGATAAYGVYFPKAHVHGIDLGPAMLRYAHKRAESLGAKVHFHQMDAGAMNFPDESFDFVVSHNLMHEVSKEALPQIFREAYRVLRPGGVVLHQDVYVRSADAPPYERFMFKWQTENNNEPFWEDFADADTVGIMKAAGFATDEIEEAAIPAIDGRRPWYAVLGEKPDAAGKRGSVFV
jgi:ubiquinone/menaquinone biosynthesis C-methylase UbiE